MPRTTLNIAAPVLKDLKRLQRREKKPIGQLVSELLVGALAESQEQKPRSFRWISRPLNPLVDLDDKDAVYRILDAELVAEVRETSRKR